MRHRHPAWISRVRARAEDNRGVAILEAAFVTPVFFILVLGIMEAGLYIKDYLAVSNSVRAGARSASAGGAQSEADLYTLLDILNEASALDEDDIEYVVVYRATGLGAGPVDANGPGTGCKSGVAQAYNPDDPNAPAPCNVYRAADFRKAEQHAKEVSAQAEAVANNQPRTLDRSKLWFGCIKDGPNANKSPDRHWCPSDRNDARSDNNKAGPDYVGVWIKAKHDWVTKMFGTQQTMTDQSVIQIEPRSE